ncbi:endonuclease MutS2, partial [Fulvivirga sp. RKSG066]|uniref:endonuclease MutS2 n=1 Tax=Fulvivirga aurantia TaxID=2529383 RepID=UPI0012BC2E1A
NLEQKLGVDQVRLLLKEKCLSNLGVSAIDKMQFSSDYDLVIKLLGQTDEFLKIIQSEETFPTNHFIDVSQSLKKAKTEGAFLIEQELLDIGNSLKAISGCVSFLEKHKETYSQLHALVKFVDFDHSVIDNIETKIDKKGEVKDNASPGLAKIRNNLKAGYTRVKKLIDRIYREAVNSGYVPDGASLTVRDGRMVIPIAAEYKRRIKGFIHDESSTGQTVFIEPTDVLEGNNELRELENAQKREVIKILTELTDLIRLNLEPIKKGYRFLSKIDFIRAKALLAQDMEAVLPEVSKNAYVDWNSARHPLLYLSYQKVDRKVIPLSINMNEDKRLVIISGPNAGGKSVCLKTVGLIQYMLQCGLLIPVEENTKAGIYKDIFIDIGDEQSLDNDLSTYSSHLTNMKYFLSNAGGKSLILIDEFGTGTDPQFGGAIAEAILDKLAFKKCQGVITTHYSNIKLYAEDHEGVVNGAMRFDMENLEPLYELEIGKPGSSFSLEISRKIGLDKDVLEYAKSAIGEKKVDVDDLILKLEKQQQQIEQRDRELKSSEQRTRSLEQKYSRLYEELETNKKKIIAQAKNEASDLLSRTNREIEKTIRHIKENKAQKTETKKARGRLEELKGKVTPTKDRRLGKPQEVIEGPIKVGDQVKLKDQDVVGKVLDIKGKDAEVQMGALKSMIKLNRLDKISNRQSKQIKNAPKRSKSMDLAQKRAHFSTTLDLRGKRGEEALPMVDKFIDDALLFSANEVKILHGKGNGILKDMIRQHLKGAPYITSMHDEHIDHGGAGITVIELS